MAVTHPALATFTEIPDTAPDFHPTATTIDKLTLLEDRFPSPVPDLVPVDLPVVLGDHFPIMVALPASPVILVIIREILKDLDPVTQVDFTPSLTQLGDLFPVIQDRLLVTQDRIPVNQDMETVITMEKR